MLSDHDSLALLESDLRRCHGRYLRDLRLVARHDGIDVEGETSTYYRKQLVIRDLLARGPAVSARVRITVRDPGQFEGSSSRIGGTSEIKPVETTQPVVPPKSDPTRQNVLIAAGDSDLLAHCEQSLNREGFSVSTAGSGLSCLEWLSFERPDVLILIGQLPWGGSDGVLDLAFEAGYLDQMLTIYIGDRDGLESLSKKVLAKLARIVVVSDGTAKAILDALTRQGVLPRSTFGRCACSTPDTGDC